MPHSPDLDLLVLGDANPDVVLGPLDGPLAFGQHERLVPTGLLTLGGSGAITACGAARLGLRVAIAARIGDDDAGRFVRAALDARGVDTSALRVVPGEATPLTTVLTRPDGDRAILTAAGTLATTGPDDVPERLLTRSRHVHAASWFLLPQLAAALPDLLRTARAHGATTSLDTNDDPAGRWDPTALAGVLPTVDVLLPNAQEALALAHLPTGTPEQAAGLLAARGPLVVVKNGGAGAFAHDGRDIVYTAGIPAEPLDTVGAGDSFDAGYLAALLADESPARALEFAAACGALSTRAHGGTPAQATRAEALAALARNRDNQGKNHS
ncbi:carbohydrate kinase family protein [Embleya sp. AB8]|uniref:carbohydrate kinase family protein n=1 Tax=Embleya sp. AB8 TaxID=3156304 RepID=UPI003C774133